MKRIHIKIRKLDDGTFYVKYWWHWWEDKHRAYCTTLEDLQTFLSNLAKKTNWGS